MTDQYIRYLIEHVGLTQEHHYDFILKNDLVLVGSFNIVRILIHNTALSIHTKMLMTKGRLLTLALCKACCHKRILNSQIYIINSVELSQTIAALQEGVDRVIVHHLIGIVIFI